MIKFACLTNNNELLRRKHKQIDSFLFYRNKKIQLQFVKLIKIEESSKMVALSRSAISFKQLLDRIIDKN